MRWRIGTSRMPSYASAVCGLQGSTHRFEFCETGVKATGLRSRRFGNDLKMQTAPASRRRAVSAFGRLAVDCGWRTADAEGNCRYCRRSPLGSRRPRWPLRRLCADCRRDYRGAGGSASALPVSLGRRHEPVSGRETQHRDCWLSQHDPRRISLNHEASALIPDPHGNLVASVTQHFPRNSRQLIQTGTQLGNYCANNCDAGQVPKIKL